MDPSNDRSSRSHPPHPSSSPQPKLPPHLIAAERALKELAPGGPAAAGLLSDGIWQADDVEPPSSLDGGSMFDARDADADATCDASEGACAAAASSSSSSSSSSSTQERNLKKYEEYFLRYQLPARIAANARPPRKPNETNRKIKAMLSGSRGGKAKSRRAIDYDDDDDDASSYAAEMPAVGGGDGVVASSGGGDAAASAAASKKASSLEKKTETETGGGDVATLPRKAMDESTFVDKAAVEMMEQLKKEATAYVNPQTGKAMRWGDTWRHAWGGGVGVGRPEHRPRRWTDDGTVQILPAATDEGYALVPTSSDKRALEEFYEQCNGLRWSVQQNWGVGEPCANGWHGVVCHGGRVTELWMNLNNVACMGQFNLTALAKLDELVYLDLSDNLFSGKIPDELYGMTKLQSLVLSSNRISGHLSNKMGRLTNLRHLDLSANDLSGSLPKSMGKMKSLEVLYLGESGLEVKNKLSGKIPSEWAGMKSLTRLSLRGNNDVKGKFPSWIGELKNLEELTLSNTGLAGEVPESIVQCENLRLLDLSQNKLSGPVPEAITRLKKLKHLRLGQNAFEGDVPRAIAELTELETLDLGSNELEGELPSSFERLSKLEYLDLSRNKFEGKLPSILPKIPTLRAVIMHQNAFEGPIPDAYLTNLPLLKHLYLEGNRLTGPLPTAALLEAKHLVEFHAHFNAIAGTIPSQFGSMPKLASLQLQGNRLVGGIPPELGDGEALARLDLSQNALVGEIPSALANATELAELTLSMNALVGAIPPSLESLPLLRKLKLDQNQLTGSVPPWLATHPCLRESDLSHNKLTGRLPETLWDETLDDGEGGEGAIPRLPARHDRPADYHDRVVNLGQNPFFCPLPDWADELSATCKQAEIASIEPDYGPAAGGTTVVVHGNWLGAADGRGSGCLFGSKTAAIWVDATDADEKRVTCASPPRSPGASTSSTVVRVGHEGEPITRLGELFRYV